MATIEQLEEEIEKIKARNKKVEADKAWELSATRNAFIAVVTFLLSLLFMLLVNESYALLKALVGTVAYLLSTASYDVLKARWLAKKRA